MKIKIPILLLILFVNVSIADACLNTYQFKIFPVGLINDTIFTVDFKIRRTYRSWGDAEIWMVLDKAENGLFKTKRKKFKPDLRVMWIIYAYTSKYDKNQNLISKDSIGMTYTYQNTYLDSLNSIYRDCYNLIIGKNPQLSIFKPLYISFCDFQQKCDILRVQNDSVLKKSVLIYENTKYPTIFEDTSYYGFKDNFYHAPDILYFFISSIRIYQSNGLELVISHLETGDALTNSNTWFEIAALKKCGRYKKPEYNSKEYKPDIDFADITNVQYEEPLLGHAYGFDLFLVKE